jgi:hypothetical protein
MAWRVATAWPWGEPGEDRGAAAMKHPHPTRRDGVTGTPLPAPSTSHTSPFPPSLMKRRSVHLPKCSPTA